MYGYSEYVPLEKEEILKRVSQEEIFELVFGYKPITNEYVTSPLRNDNLPDCWFDWYGSKLMFKDFGDPRRVNRDCFQAVMDYYDLSLNDACAYINTQFNLGLGEGNNVDAKPVTYDISIIKKKKVRVDITFKPRFFDLRDKEFWSSYGISKENLVEDKVFAVRWYKFYSTKSEKWITIRPFNICYAYTDFENHKMKIYAPYENKVGKWISNCSVDDIGSIDHLPIGGEKLIITKSYKDCRVLRNLGYNSIWFQNEGMLPSDDVIKNLCKRFDEIIVFFDNDKTGVSASIKVASIINSHYSLKARELYLPSYLLEEGIKDPSDLRREKGEKELKEFLNQKI